MHEMGIALEIIEIATASIPPEARCAGGAGKPDVGKLRPSCPTALRFCFEIVSKDTAAGRHAAHRRNTGGGPLPGLQWRGPSTEAVFTCPACGSGSVEILSGRELDIVSIEIAQRMSMETVNDKRRTREIKVVRKVLDVNERMAAQNRRRFAEQTSSCST